MVLSKVLATTPKPSASVFSSMALAAAISSAQVVGGASGSRPAAANRSLFQYRALVENATGRPHWVPSKVTVSAT
ncbi:hypothetical protein D3C72_1977530 [compost metagenome]